ncbi:acyltransferase family protein [Mycobacterium avium]|uniref:acyltransferase family protein n=1 Tax=Mycobacterium avium TaxID=1764 RepID=UPI0003D2006D|nr:acyltransferase [Mycobacterium avium]ETB24464.1 acyltransferase [Mycobacterium avium subsp. hominissuis 10-4249]KDO97620.1 acyltransferase [Mycobacterium avium subsp. hominissuis A5]
MKLGQVFDPRRNALNALRLVLAAEVMLFHSWPITGHMPPKSILQLFFSVGVDGFFAISGFLITRSWLSDPRLRDYLTARGLRILPGFYICLIVTAFVFAPLSVVIQGGSPAKLLGSAAPLEYVLKNSAIVYLQPSIDGTLHGVPGGNAWNGSMWSLIWELLCYLVVAAIGVVGLGNRRWISPLILVLATLGALVVPPLTFPGVWTIPQLAVRSAIMFSAGAVMYQWRDVIPARWSLVAVALAIVAAAGFLPDYRVVGALPLAYAVIVTGSLLKSERLVLRTDLSYGVYIYAFPTQQLLAVCGLATRLHPALFFLASVAATLPLAAASWFLIEKPSMALKRRLKRKWTGPRAAESDPRVSQAEPAPADVLADRPAPEAPGHF